MKNLKFYLDARDAKTEDALATVKIKYTKDRRASHLATDVRVMRSQWDAEQEIIKLHPQARALNLYLANIMTEVESIIMNHRTEFRDLTAIEIMQRVKEIQNPKEEVEAADLFYPRAIKFIESKDKPRTKDIYNATLRRIQAHCPKYDTLRFCDITPDWLREFDKFLMQTSPSRNARNIHFRNIRSIFNDAIDDEVTNYYPFRRFKIRPEATAKRSLSIEQLAKLFLHQPEEYAERYLDMFKLMFYLIGINTADLTALTSINNGRIEYHRAKTNRLYSIKVEPEAMEIINKYRGDERLIGFFGNYVSYLSFGRLMNKALHAIGKELDGKKKDKIYSGLTTYWARHSWATIAAELDIPKETIAKALGHSDRDVTDVYIRFDYKKVDKANRQVIDYLNKHIEKLKAGS